MDQTYHILKELLRELGVKVPNPVIRHQLETPVGNTIRGISDALDSLNIENNVYNLPEVYLCELEYPYLMVLPYRKDSFVIVANDSEKKKALPDWGGVVLTAKKTENTPTYKNVWLRNIAEWQANHQTYIACAILLVGLIINALPNFVVTCHTVISCIGLWISYCILKKEYNVSALGRYCKVGKYIDCEQVFESKGSRFLGIYKMSDLSFLFFSTQIFLLFFHNDGHFFSFLLMLIGCGFTLYSVVYQITVIRKICLYCMSINFIVWLDTIIYIFNRTTMSNQNPFLLTMSGCIAYMLWIMNSRTLSLTVQKASLMSKASVLYNRDLFDWLLSKERQIEDVDDKFADVGGDDNGDVITMFVHPNCKNCKRVYQYIPELREKTLVKTVSLACDDVKLHEYCKRNQLNKTPTVVFNGRKLPELYDVDDLKYVI